MQKIELASSALVATSDDICPKKKTLGQKSCSKNGKVFTHAIYLETESNDFRNFSVIDEE